MLILLKYYTHGFIGPRNAQIFSLNNAQILIWPPEYRSSQFKELSFLPGGVCLWRGPEFFGVVKSVKYFRKFLVV